MVFVFWRYILVKKLNIFVLLLHYPTSVLDLRMIDTLVSVQRNNKIKNKQRYNFTVIIMDGTLLYSFLS